MQPASRAMPRMAEMSAAIEGKADLSLSLRQVS
jgi:hypothetical protein